MPGHIFPLMAQPGGVLKRAGHTEAGCDLGQLAGLTPASVICEILKDDGTMARLPDLVEFGKAHDLKIGAIADLIHYRSQNEALVERVSDKTVRTPYGEFQLLAFQDKTADETHLALVKGRIDAAQETLVRVHEPISILDFLDAGTGHSWSMESALKALATTERGVMVLLHRPETGADLLHRLGAKPQPAPKFDLRNYGIGAQILRDIGVGKMRLMAHPRRMPSMTGFGLEVTGFIEEKEG
jgi:3,4-dihydroxy 2-butanone 4-phosphate synthase/GTP cyclohydrolase II